MMPPRAYIFIGLNAVRALSMIALILVFASSVFVMVNDIKAYNAFIAAGAGSSTATASDATNSTVAAMVNCQYIANSTVPNQPAGIFWAVLNRLLIIFQVIVLFLSEIGWPAVFFDRFFPVLGKDFGLGALGVIQGLIGAAVLSHHCDDFSLVSAFFLFALGCLNMFCGLIFRAGAKTKRSFTAWKENKKALLPTTVRDGFVTAVFHQPTGSSGAESVSTLMSEKAGLGFGRQGEKAAALKGFYINKPVESLPRYMPEPNRQPRSSSPTFQSSDTAI